MQVGRHIKRLRKGLKLSQKQLGDRLGVAQNTVCNWETARTLPGLDTLAKIAGALKTTVARLVA